MERLEIEKEGRMEERRGNAPSVRTLLGFAQSDEKHPSI